MPSAARFLTMRAAVERDVEDGDTDPFNQPTTTVQQVASRMRCYLYGKDEQTILDGDKSVTIGDYTMLVKRNADIRELDRITAVKDKSGVDFLSGGRMRVLKVIPRQGWGPQRLRFKECMLEQIK